jgi:hypothetical protein
MRRRTQTQYTRKRCACQSVCAGTLPSQLQPQNTHNTRRQRVRDYACMGAGSWPETRVTNQIHTRCRRHRCYEYHPRAAECEQLKHAAFALALSLQAAPLLQNHCRCGFGLSCSGKTQSPLVAYPAPCPCHRAFPHHRRRPPLLPALPCPLRLGATAESGPCAMSVPVRSAGASAVTANPCAATELLSLAGPKDEMENSIAGPWAARAAVLAGAVCPREEHARHTLQWHRRSPERAAAAATRWSKRLLTLSVQPRVARERDSVLSVPLADFCTTF